MTGRTPFFGDSVLLPGSARPRVKAAPPGLRNWWLGRPGTPAGMVQLPFPSLGYQAPASQGESASTSIGGTTSTSRRRRATRSWTLNWARMSGRDYEIIYSFWRRWFGPGPWCFTPPEHVNRLDEFASLCGAANGAVEGWAASAGTVEYDDTIEAPLLPGGVLRWSGAGSGSLLVCGDVVAGVPTPDTTRSAPYLYGEPLTVSLWAWAESGTVAAKVRASGRLTDATVATELDHSVALTTTPTRIAVTAGPGDLGDSHYVLPVLRCGAAGAPDILVSAPQLEYYGAATDWFVGRGVPRVVSPDPLPDPVDGRYMHNVAWRLAE